MFNNDTLDRYNNNDNLTKTKVILDNDITFIPTP